MRLLLDILSFVLFTVAITYGMTETTPMALYRMLAQKALVALGPFMAGIFIPALYCPACTGFWVGGALGVAYFDDLGWLAIAKAACAGLVLGKIWSRTLSNADLTFHNEITDPFLMALFNMPGAGEHHAAQTQEGDDRERTESR